MNRRAELTVAGINGALSLFDFSVPLKLTYLQYITRPPLPIVKYDKIVRPFPVDVWIMIVLCCLLLTLLMFLIYQVHMMDTIIDNNMVKKERLIGNLLIFPFMKIIEPDPLPWFEKWSSGKLVYFVWMIFSTFIVLFYTSNLRAHLVYIDYEKAPEDLKDIYERGKTVYVYNTAIRQR